MNDNVLFIHIPRTAGNWIKQSIGIKNFNTPTLVNQEFKGKGIVSFGHQDYKELVKSGIVKKKFDKSAFKFCFCRNPFDRAVSYYFWTLKIRPEILPGSKSFLEFSKNLNNIKPLREHIYKFLDGVSFCPQHNHIRNIKIDFIGRFENLEEDLKEVADILNLKVRSVKPNHQTCHYPYQNYYNDESVSNILEYYKKDFEYFGYKKQLE